MNALMARLEQACADLHALKTDARYGSTSATAQDKNIELLAAEALLGLFRVVEKLHLRKASLARSEHVQ